MRQLLPIALVALTTTTALAGEPWNVVDRSKNLKTGEQMLSLNRLSRDTAFADCKAWASKGGDIAHESATVTADTDTMFMMELDAERVRLGCQQVTRTLLQTVLHLPESLADDLGLELKEKS